MQTKKLTRIVDRLRADFGNVLTFVHEEDFNSSLAAVIRFKAPTYTQLMRISESQAHADVRFQLWKHGRLVKNEGQELVPDGVPLRSFWPEKFIEPMKIKRGKIVWSSRFSYLWQIAPFELRLVATDRPVGKWMIREELDVRNFIDDSANVSTERTEFIGQLTRQFTFHDSAQFVRIFRWNPFKKL
jgi:hypothetical protein